MRVEDNIALIENPLLCAAIWGDFSCIHQRGPKFSGYVNANADKACSGAIETKWNGK